MAILTSPHNEQPVQQFVMPRISSVTLSWNLLQETTACLSSLQAQTYPHLHSILVDNNSTDSTPEVVKSQFPNVTLIENKTNRGYAAAINQGLQAGLEAQADFLWIVDNDAIADPQALERLVEVALARPDIALFTPKIFYLDPPDLVWSIGHRRRPLTLAPIKGGMGKAEPEVPAKMELRDYAPCCGLLIRREVLEKVGLLDQRFFIYYEDLDLCIRAAEAGYRLSYVPSAMMWHNVSRSAGAGSPLQKYYLARSSVHFFLKHTPWWLKPMIIIYRCGSGVKTVCKSLLVGQPGIASAYLRGIRDGVQEHYARLG